MKILKISGKNLASLAGQFEVDFEQLNFTTYDHMWVHFLLGEERGRQEMRSSRSAAR